MLLIDLIVIIYNDVINQEIKYRKHHLYDKIKGLYSLEINT